MAASQAGNFNLQELSSLGALLVGGRLYTYTFGTTTLKTAYTDAAGTVPHTYTSDGVGGSYIALNARGELPAPLYLATGSYDIALKDSTGATIWTRRADPVADVLLPPFSFAGGVVANPTYGFSGGAGTGMYSPAANQIAWAYGGVQGMLFANGGLTINEPSSGSALKAFGTVFTPAIYAVGQATTGQSFGAQIDAGTNSSDTALLVRNQTGGTNYLRVRGDGMILARGIDIPGVKGGTTSITANSTLTDDSSLRAVLAAGPITYAFELWIPVWASAANSLKWQMAFSGAQTLFLYTAQYTAGGVAGQTGVVTTGTPLTMALGTTGEVGADFLVIKGVITVTTAGVLTFQEAQATNNANAVNIGQGAWIKVTQVS